jgi:hypothetical protein
MKASSYIFLIMAGVIAFLLWRLAAVNRKLESSAAVLQEKDAQITYFKAQSGKTVGVKPAAEISKSDLQKHYSDLSADLKDMKIKLNSVRAVLKAVVQSQGQGMVTIVHDTVRLPGLVPIVLDSVFIDDHYLSLRGGIKGQQFGYKYTYQDSIVFAISSRKKLFGKETLIGSAKLSNPNAKSISQTAILIERRNRRFVISGGLNYDPFSNRFSAGLHAGYALIKL